MSLKAALFASLVASIGASPLRVIKRQVSELDDSYDFVIAGGGTAGLTVADRLSEAFPDKSVLVIEYGEVEYAAGVFDPPQVIWRGEGGDSATAFVFNSLPNPEVLNKTAFVMAGQAVGGSSCINGQFFDRPSKWDFEAWNQLLGPEYDDCDTKWDWDGIYDYFKKSVTFTEPPASVVAEHGYTWDLDAYGGSTPIYSSFPPFLWGDHYVFRDGFQELGAPVLEECAGGDKNGVCWIPTSADPVTFLRSHSGIGHYTAVNETRSNYHLLVKHQVTRVLYEQGLDHTPIVEVRDLSDDSIFTVSADLEVVLSAGTFHTPTILQRSGIGPASYLEQADIDVVLDLPGVGSNFQDHSGPGLEWNYTKPADWFPLATDMLDDDFLADATAGFDEVPARGPYTLAMANMALFLSLVNVTSEYATIVAKIRDQVTSGTAASFLPLDYRDDPEMIAGYELQLSVLADLFENPELPSLESPYATGGTALPLISLHTLSRGTVRLDPANHFEQPIVDYRTGSNPVDFDVHLAHIKYLREVFNTPTVKQYEPLVWGPPDELQSDEDLIQYIKETMVFSYMHPCCTAAMMPKEKGGVVGPELKVHGASGLRVVDMSVIPILPSSHLSAEAYAIGEKLEQAADLIIAEHS
ncbi:hypothetical protein jhhlp_001595 [Lomentospora prolificans]|uniref:Glucose-methanol-choline oxidoreductase N-terminal domain-containing protein n=1 Tax=Lomentospora prolificans TaxID=41688 RepID=A0A2N3NIM9_9PEZI|nr:hypothetical protein jhhlp_001595 [Lomentospora prolificans]